MSWEISWICKKGLTVHVLSCFTGEWLSWIKEWSTLNPWGQHVEVSFNLKLLRGQIHDWLHVLMVAVPDDQKVPLKLLMEDWKIVNFKMQKSVQVNLPLNENCKCSWRWHLKHDQGLVALYPDTGAHKANALKWKYRKHVSYPSSHYTTSGLLHSSAV